MMESRTTPSPAVSGGNDARHSWVVDRTILIERLATEMRLGSGNELPHSFCVAQIKRQLSKKDGGTGPTYDTPATSGTRGTSGSSVFHSWAMRE